MLRLDRFVRSATNVLLRGTFAQQVVLCKNVFLQLSILLNNMALGSWLTACKDVEEEPGSA